VTAFSCPACDIFAFDTADELVDHINQAHMPPSAAPETQPTPPPSWPTAPTSSGWDVGITPTTPPTPAPPTPPAPAQPQSAARIVFATPPQRRYLENLQAERPGASTLDPQTATKAEASAEIERLLTLPRTAPRAPQPADVPTGMHYRDGIIYDVKRSKAGRLYALVLVLNPHGQGGHWEYRKDEPLRLLSSATALVRDTQAA
jgi:hypothetical protein